MDFTETWNWPQWTMAIWLMIALSLASIKHGDEMRETAGLRKGEVRKYSFHISAVRAGLLLFILIAGGFFA